MHPLFVKADKLSQEKISFATFAAFCKKSGIPLSFWPLITPIQSNRPQLIPHLGQIPDLRVAQVHARGEVASIRAKGQRERPLRQREKQFRRLRVVEAGGAEI